MVIDINELLKYVTLVKDSLSILSTIILAIVAILGLKTWRRQKDFETGRRLLHTVYRLRDAIQGVRNPFASANEISAALKDAGIEVSPTSQEFNLRSQQALYASRWKLIQECLPELQATTFEAEVIWGKEVKNKVLLLVQCYTQLNIYLDLYLRSLNSQNHVDRTTPEMRQKIEEAIYDFGPLTGEKRDNWLTKLLNDATEQIENFVKGKMRFLI